jgi:hypothetical protein
MMTVADWRRRAQECTAKSKLALNQESRLQWQALSGDWLRYAELYERLKFGSSATPVTGPDAAAARQDGMSAIDDGERLRGRLALVDSSTAQSE